jgi:hypothetical protein
MAASVLSLLLPWLGLVYICAAGPIDIRGVTAAECRAVNILLDILSFERDPASSFCSTWLDIGTTTISNTYVC